MHTMDRQYKFIGKVLPDGHLSIPAELAKDPGKEFEVIMTPIDDIQKYISLYIEGRISKKGKLKDISLNFKEIEKALKKTFGTNDLNSIIESIRK